MTSLRQFLILVAILLSGCASVQDSLYDAGLSVARWQLGLIDRCVATGTETLAYVERAATGASTTETIVLLHGFAGRKDVWLKFIPRLPSRYRVIAFDMPGHGDSSNELTRRYAPRNLAAAVARAIDELRLESFHLAGNSLGGLVATLYALEHPARVKTLGLFAPAGVYPPIPSEFQQRLDRGENPLLVTTRADFGRLMEFIFVDPPFMPWPVRSVLARDYVRRAPVTTKVWSDLVDEFTDVREHLPGLRPPVFILWGKADRVLHVSSLEVYTEHLPAAEVHVIENSGHVPMIEQPETAAALYADFLGSHGNSEDSTRRSRIPCYNNAEDALRRQYCPP